MLDIFSDLREKADILPCGLKVLRSTNQRGLPTAMIWLPKGKKPTASYYFDSEEQRETFIQKRAESLVAHQQLVDERKKARKGSAEQANSVQVGSIFHHSWGYDQTNADFYEVIAKNGRQLTLREINAQNVGNNQGHSMSSTCVPVPGSFKGEPFKKLLQFSGDRAYVTISSYGWCDLWDGKPVNYSWYA